MHHCAAHLEQKNFYQALPSCLTELGWLLLAGGLPQLCERPDVHGNHKKSDPVKAEVAEVALQGGGGPRYWR